MVIAEYTCDSLPALSRYLTYTVVAPLSGTHQSNLVPYACHLASTKAPLLLTIAPWTPLELSVAARISTTGLMPGQLFLQMVGR